MSTFIGWLQKELDRIGPEDIFDSGMEIGIGEIEIGVADNEMQKMYTLRELCYRNSDELSLSAKYERDNTVRSSIIIKSANFKYFALLWDSMLWQAVYQQFPDALQYTQVGLRKGFVIVGMNHNTTDILRKLFGSSGSGLGGFGGSPFSF